MRTRLISVLSGLLLALSATALAAAPQASAATGPAAVAEALKEGPVYVDPRAAAQLPKDQADALAKKIKDAGKPVFVAVLPNSPEFPADSLLRTVRTETGITGLYAIRLGDGFDAGADRTVMRPDAVRNLTDAVKAGGPVDAATQLNNFVDQALTQARGRAPASWGGGSADSGAPVGALVGLGAVALLGGGGAYALVRNNRRKKEAAEREAVERLRVVVDEDITAFGEELERLDFHPGERGADDAMRQDYERALDSYDRAKQIMGGVQHPEEVKGVTQALEDGRFSLAVLAARREGRPLPERRAPCFFDPRHGPSTEDATWAPVGGSARTVPVCAADAVRLREGRDPAVRTVDTERGPRPYYDAGPAYGPWAGGYFGGGILPGLLVGTVLGSMMSSPAYASDWGGYDAGGFEGGAEILRSDWGLTWNAALEAGGVMVSDK
ncbi:YceI family protein, partial [Streptomyces sp. WAC06614]|uniref:YceI family protein n=1 Tax=Streptomyces sp. WAC06614 TaxID=2487416 RepID=UPI000FBEC59F